MHGNNVEEEGKKLVTAHAGDERPVITNLRDTLC